jgi:YesN/AraC family two-component response regulator
MSTDTHEGALVERVAAWVHDHAADPITTKAIAAALDRHPNYLGAVFHKVTGVSVMTYVTRVRMQRAAELILSGDKIDAVVLCTGYQSKSTFYRHFRQHFGMSPRLFRDRKQMGSVE